MSVGLAPFGGNPCCPYFWRLPVSLGSYLCHVNLYFTNHIPSIVKSSSEILRIPVIILRFYQLTQANLLDLKILIHMCQVPFAREIIHRFQGLAWGHGRGPRKPVIQPNIMKTLYSKNANLFNQGQKKKFYQGI